MLFLKAFILCVTVVTVSSFYLCSMPQWEAVQSTLVGTYSNGEPNVIQRNTEVSYDFNNSRIATTTYITQDGQRVEQKNIYNYEQKILYAIKGDSCTKILLNEHFREACVPLETILLCLKENSCVTINENFSWTMTKTFYGMGYTGQNDHLFIFEFQGKVNDLKHILQTTYNGNPVFEVIHGVTGGASLFSNSAYLNMTVGIKNPDVFNPPVSCFGLSTQINYGAIPKRLGVLTF